VTPAEEAYRQRRFVVPPDATEIVLVRHGASAPVVPGVDHDVLADGRGDPPLAPEGLVQADRVAARLGREPISAVFVTPMRRTMETAAPLVEITGLCRIVIPELAEVHLGEWEPVEHRIRVEAEDPIWRRTLREQRWDVIPGAEPMTDLAARVRDGVGAIVAEVGPGRVGVAFLHGGVIGEICRQAVDSQPFSFIYADNCSMTRLLRRADGEWMLRSFNETGHLDEPPKAGEAGRSDRRPR
jgi:probable phosphoglycerate mutase